MYKFLSIHYIIYIISACVELLKRIFDFIWTRKQESISINKTLIEEKEDDVIITESLAPPRTIDELEILISNAKISIQKDYKEINC
jgi:hypothetical protein